MPLLTFTQTFMISLFQSMKFKLLVMMKGKYLQVYKCYGIFQALNWSSSVYCITIIK